MLLLFKPTSPFRPDHPKAPWNVRQAKEEELKKVTKEAAVQMEDCLLDMVFSVENPPKNPVGFPTQQKSLVWWTLKGWAFQKHHEKDGRFGRWIKNHSEEEKGTSSFTKASRLHGFQREGGGSVTKMIFLGAP